MTPELTIHNSLPVIEPATIDGVKLPHGWSIDGNRVLDERGKVVMGLGRVTMLLHLAPYQEFREAWEARLQYKELAGMFHCNDSTDISVLRRIYQMPERARVVSRPSAVAVDTHLIAEQVIEIAMEKVTDAVAIQVKIAIANALEDVAAKLRA